MRNDDIKWKVQQVVDLIDDWLEYIEGEEDPEAIFKREYPQFEGPSYPWQAGTWKARADMNADKLRRINAYLINEFKNIGVQSLPKVVK